MTLAILIFMGGALVLAAFLIVSSDRTTRHEQRELERARAREEAARLDAEAARATRARWEAKIAADSEMQRNAIVAGGDPRGLGDGLGAQPAPVAPARTRRFRRSDAPAPFSR